MGLRGYKILAPALDTPIDHPSAYPTWEAAADLEIPVLIHFGVLGGGGGVSQHVNMSPLSLHDVARDFASVQFVIPHLGCGYVLELLHLMWSCPNVHVDTSGSNQWIRWMPEEITHRSKELHVAIAMSGGVDSSVAALLVKRAGFRCSALFMKNWNEPTNSGSCNWENDVADALEVCEHLDVPINTVDLSETYWNKVFEDFLEQYRNGRTPNPDVLCNREIKFKAFLEHAQSFGADMIATGHYVASDVQNGYRRLLKGADPSKDQSYFLYTLDQQQLDTSLFPLGMARKSDVRKLAQDAGLKTHDKKDSTCICFIG